MPDYAVYGGRLRSALVLPELRPALPHPRPPDWTLRVAPLAGRADGPDSAERIGGQRYADDVDVELLRAGERWRVTTSDVGDFDLGADGEITWWCREGAREDLAGFDLLGRVLPLLLYREGALPLHASSVVVGSEAVAFVGPKGHGKSTLALCLAQRGARLLSDDVSVLRLDGGAVIAHPGVHAVRLWEDAAERLDVRAYGAPGAIGRKLVVGAVPPALLADEPAPLAAVYVLQPPAADRSGETSDASEAAARRPLGATAAALALVRHTTAGGLLGGGEAARVLERAAAVARLVPVYALDLARDFARLDEAAATVAGWHPPAEVTA